MNRPLLRTHSLQAGKRMRSLTTLKMTQIAAVKNSRKSFSSIPFQTQRNSNSFNATAALIGILLVGTAVVAGASSIPNATCEGNGTVVPESFKMPHRILGNTGLQVSVLSYGFWATFGAKSDLKSDAGLEKAKDCLRKARDYGVNLFDNAEVYGEPEGAAEIIMGEAIRQLREENPTKWRRSDLIISTKIFWGGKGVNERGLSKKHIDEGVDACLQRLQMSYVDLLFCHRPDPLTPTETVVRAMTDVVRSGKAKSWGTSEWSAQQFTEAVWIAKQYGLEPPSYEQPQYNMFHREKFESEYFPLFAPTGNLYNMGTTIWSPLASGLLTGKYNEGIPAGSRADDPSYSWLKGRIEQSRKEGKLDKVKLLMDYAQTHFQCSVGQLALAWCLKNKNVSTVLLGATKTEQLDENFGAVEVARKLTPKHMAEIDVILGNKPVAYGGYGSLNSIRPVKDSLDE